MTRGWDAAGSRFQAADATEMCGHANGASTIAAYASRRATSGDRSRFATAGTTRSPAQVPGIIRPAIKKIVSFPGHQEFGRIRDTKNDSSSGAQAPYQRRIVGSNVAIAQFASCLTPQPRNIDRALDADRHAIEQSHAGALAYRPLRRPSIAASAIRVEVNKCVQFGIEFLDALRSEERRGGTNRLHWRC